MGTMADALAIHTTQSEMSSFFIDIMGLVNPKSYGAKGDGTTDDSTAITAAITAAQTAGIKSIRVPKGSYYIGSAITVTSQSLDDKFDIIAEDGGVTFINEVESGSCIKFVSTTATIWRRVRVIGVKFTSNTMPADSDMIEINGGCFGGGIYNCTFTGTDSTTVINGSAIVLKSNELDYGLTKNFNIKGNKIFYFRDCGIETESSDSYPALVTIEHNDIEMCKKGGIYGAFENVSIKNNIFAYNGVTTDTGGITIFGNVGFLRSVEIENNGFEHNASYHVNLYRVVNASMKMNFFNALADGTSGINNDYAFISNNATYGIVFLDLENNRVEAAPDNYVGFKAGTNVSTLIDIGNEFSITGGSYDKRDYHASVKAYIIDENNDLITTRKIGFAAAGSDTASGTLEKGTTSETKATPGISVPLNTVAVALGEYDINLNNGFAVALTTAGGSVTINNPTNIPGHVAEITLAIYHTAQTTVSWGTAWKIDATYTQSLNNNTFDILKFITYSGTLKEATKRTVDIAI